MNICKLERLLFFLTQLLRFQMSIKSIQLTVSILNYILQIQLFSVNISLELHSKAVPYLVLIFDYLKIVGQVTSVWNLQSHSKFKI